jgi:RNA polymerase subunit RPABC4/transcription elongation factor Spt4
MDGPNVAERERQCPWCSAVAAVDATHCPACGAALAQRESIADLVIAGVTTVDPALAA